LQLIQGGGPTPGAGFVRPSCLASAVFCLLFVATAWGVCQEPTPKPCSAFFSSDVVVSGTVEAVQEVPEADG